MITCPVTFIRVDDLRLIEKGSEIKILVVKPETNEYWIKKREEEREEEVKSKRREEDKERLEKFDFSR